MAINRAPWMGSITLTTNSTAYNLWTLLSAIVTNNPANKTPKAEYLSLQVDPASGAAKVYVGNSAVAANFCGVCLFATQAYVAYPLSSNLVKLDDIYLMSDTDDIQINVTFITR